MKPRVSLALVAAAWATARLLAQAESAARPAVAGGAGPLGATIPHVDKSFGFELHVPAGWRYDRTGFFGAGGALGLLRGTSPDGRATLQILLFKNVRQGLNDWIEYFARQLGTLDGVQSVRVKGAGAEQRSAAFVVADSLQALDRIESDYYCTPLEDGGILVLSLAWATSKSSAPAAPAAAAEVTVHPAFEQLADSLHIFYSAPRAAAQREALTRGRMFLASFQLQENIRRLRVDQNVRHYEIVLAGQPIGYLTRQFAREQHDLDESRRRQEGKDGLRVRETSWRFAPDGAVRYSVVDLFSSVDAATDLFDLWEATVPAQPADAPPLITRDQCVREGDVLFSSYAASGQKSEPRLPIKLPETYLGLAWARLIPALLLREPGPPTAFSVYDPETRTLVATTVEPKGAAGQPDSSAAYLYELHEGLLPTPGKVTTDARGHMLRYEAGQFVIRLADAESIERTFAARRDAARARLASVAVPPQK